MVQLITPDACVIVLQAEMCPIFSVDSFYHKGACLVFVFHFLSPHVVITWHLVTDMLHTFIIFVCGMSHLYQFCKYMMMYTIQRMGGCLISCKFPSYIKRVNHENPFKVKNISVQQHQKCIRLYFLNGDITPSIIF